MVLKFYVASLIFNLNEQKLVAEKKSCAALYLSLMLLNPQCIRLCT
jgi:hypothetical protein